MADLFGKIGNKLMTDLDFSGGFNHTFMLRNVANYETNPFSNDDPPKYFYPIVHNGYEYSGDTVNVSGSTSGTTRLYTSTKVGSYSDYSQAYADGVKRYRINSPEDGIYDNQLKGQ